MRGDRASIGGELPGGGGRALPAGGALDVSLGQRLGPDGDVRELAVELLQAGHSHALAEQQRAAGPLAGGQVEGDRLDRRAIEEDPGLGTRHHQSQVIPATDLELAAIGQIEALAGQVDVQQGALTGGRVIGLTHQVGAGAARGHEPAPVSGRIVEPEPQHQGVVAPGQGLGGQTGLEPVAGGEREGTGQHRQRQQQEQTEERPHRGGPALGPGAGRLPHRGEPELEPRAGRRPHRGEPELEPRAGRRPHRGEPGLEPGAGQPPAAGETSSG